MIRKWISKGHGSDGSDPRWSGLIHHLRDLGMWDDADRAELESKFDTMITRQNFWLVESPRFIMADSEAFAEAGIGVWLDENRETLAKYGFTYHIYEDRCCENDYVFILDGVEHTVYTQQQLENDNIWEIATRFVQQLINTQLRSNGIKTRAYLFYGGNDGQIAMLTPQMADAMIDSGLIEKKNQPCRLDSED